MNDPATAAGDVKRLLLLALMPEAAFRSTLDVMTKVKVNKQLKIRKFVYIRWGKLREFVLDFFLPSLDFQVLSSEVALDPFSLKNTTKATSIFYF